MKVKRDSNPLNDWQDGYNSGRRYWERKLKSIINKLRRKK